MDQTKVEKLHHEAVRHTFEYLHGDGGVGLTLEQDCEERYAKLRGVTNAVAGLDAEFVIETVAGTVESENPLLAAALREAVINSAALTK